MIENTKDPEDVARDAKDDHGHDYVLDRKWMQNDILHKSGMDSTEVTPGLLRRRAERGNLRFVPRGEGNLISSMVEPDRHRPVLDLDRPHMYVPSSTPGHGHLYINNVVLSDLEHYYLIHTLVQFGILGKGSRVQLDTHNMSLTRPPRVKKSSPWPDLDHYAIHVTADEDGNVTLYLFPNSDQPQPIATLNPTAAKELVARIQSAVEQAERVQG